MRIALLVDPLTYRVKGGSHAPPLAQELTRRGHRVRLYGAPVELRLAREPEGADGAGLRDFAPDWVIAYDELSPTAWRGAKSARREGARLLLVETGRDAKDVPTHERALRALGERLWGRSVREAASGVLALDPVARMRALAQGFEAEQVRMLPEGVDCQHFRPGRGSAWRSCSPAPLVRTRAARSSPGSTASDECGSQLPSSQFPSSSARSPPASRHPSSPAPQLPDS